MELKALPLILAAGLVPAAAAVWMLSQQNVASAAEPWAIEADIAESCSCKPVCPCMFGSPPTKEPCEGSRLYEIKKGYFDGVRLDGLQIVATFRVGKWVKYYVSARATDEQLKAVEPLISRTSPVLAVDVLTIEKVPVSVERTETRVRFTAPASTVEIEVMRGREGKPIEIHNLADVDLDAYKQYKSIENSHKSPKHRFHYSGTNGFTSKIDTRG